jgi:ABC-type transport system involved in cytochrome c biogenesis permease component
MILRPIYAVIEREVVRMFRQRTRLVSAMVRPLIWLFVIGAGFGAVIGRSGEADYQQFLAPGVLGMTILFGAMLAALTMVYDKESGVMRMLIIAPFPHHWIVVAKTIAAALAGLIQAALLLVVFAVLGFLSWRMNYPLLLVGILITLLCGARHSGRRVHSNLGQLRGHHELRDLPGVLSERCAVPHRTSAVGPEDGGHAQSLHLLRGFAQARNADAAGVRLGV